MTINAELLDCWISGTAVVSSQPGGDMVVGSAEELTKRGKVKDKPKANVCSTGDLTRGTPDGPDTEEGEGEGGFWGMERLSSPRGSVMVWDSAKAGGETSSVVIITQ